MAVLAWSCLRTTRSCAPTPSALAHPRGHGLHPRCMLAARAAVARGRMECAVCAATPSCISLILPKCSARHSHSSLPQCEHAALNQAPPNSNSRKPMAWDVASGAQRTPPRGQCLRNGPPCPPRPAPRPQCGVARRLEPQEASPVWGVAGGVVGVVTALTGCVLLFHTRNAPGALTIHPNAMQEAQHSPLQLPMQGRRPCVAGSQPPALRPPTRAL